MKVRQAEKFVDALAEAPASIQKAFYKQLHFLVSNLRHPSLHAKKYREGGDLWQARVTQDWRFYFTIESNEYHLHTIVRHPK